MKKALFYLFLPLIYGISLLPFPLLYLFSDFLRLLIYNVFGYRKKVVAENLKNAFPEKSDAERKQIAKDFYVYLCDVLLETLKLLTVSEKGMLKRCQTIEGLDKVNSFLSNGQSIITVMGHFGNWEWANPMFRTLMKEYKLTAVYKTLSNENFDKLFLKARTNFGATLIPMEQTLRAFVSAKSTPTNIALIADQVPSPKNAQWINFLNQDTACFVGTEKLARKFNFPIFYGKVIRIGRGRYKMVMELLEENPSNTQEGEITKKHMGVLEDLIRQQPATWLWSHKRWKHKRPS